MPFHRAKSVFDAVQLATQFKQRGDYDWFRGQVQDWPRKSSFVRRPPAEKDALLQRAARFEHWVHATPGLESLASSPDAIVAVAQHYGIPTNFIDFTAEPPIAGFFASDNPPTDPGRESCILCLNTEDLARFWRSMPSKYPPPEFLRLDVENLWRLEAQAGVFLFCPYGNFEAIYDVDRIFFPYTGPVLNPKPEQVYPTRKSQLEILLDQYFMIERLGEGNRHIEQQVARGLWTVQRVVTKQLWSPDLVVDAGPPVLGSWQPDSLRGWLSPDRERYLEARTDLETKIEVNIEAIRSAKIRDALRAEVFDRVRGFAGTRGSLLAWKIQLRDAPPTDSFHAALSRAVTRLWDGLRILPYDIEDLAQGIANCLLVALAARSIGTSTVRDPWLEASTMALGESIEVEFGSDDSSYARGYASKNALLAAVRDDIFDFVKPAYRQMLTGNMVGHLQAVQAPERLFEFHRLAQVFAQQLVPTQVLTRVESAIFYTPARLAAFGLP